MLYLFLADGFEEIEAITVIDILRRAEINITTISISKDLLVKGGHDIYIKADDIFENLDYSNILGIILPGGLQGTNNLSNHSKLKDLILNVNEKNDLIMAICAAPSILGKYGILANKKATSYPTFIDKLNGATVIDEAVVVDGNIITSQGAGTSMLFALKIVEIIKGKDVSNKLAKAMIFKNQVYN